MSNNNHTYGLPYSSLRLQQPAFQQGQQNRQPTSRVSSPMSSHGFQTAAEITTTYGASQYQRPQYSQQRQSNDAASFNWYGGSINGATMGQRRDSFSSNEVQGNQTGAGMIMSSENMYNNQAQSGYSYPSSLGYGVGRTVGHQMTEGFEDQNRYIGRASDNVGIPYQPCMGRSYESPMQTTTISSPALPATMRGQNHDASSTEVAVIKDTAPCVPLSYSATIPRANASSQARVAVGTDAPKGNTSLNAAKRRRQLPKHDNAQNTLPQTSSRSQLVGSQNLQGSGKQGTRTIPLTARNSKESTSKHQEPQYGTTQTQREAAEGAADLKHARLAAPKARRGASKAALRALLPANSKDALGDRIKATHAPDVRISTAKTIESSVSDESSAQPRDSPISSQNGPSNNVTLQNDVVEKGPTVVAIKEILLMVEKIQEYQNRDPKLLYQVREALKKRQDSSQAHGRSSTGPDSSQSLLSQNKASTNLMPPVEQQIARPIPSRNPAGAPSTPAKTPWKRRRKTKAELSKRTTGVTTYLTLEQANRAKTYISPWPSVGYSSSDWSTLKTAGDPPGTPTTSILRPGQPSEPEVPLESEASLNNMHPTPQAKPLLNLPSVIAPPKLSHNSILTRPESVAKPPIPVHSATVSISSKSVAPHIKPVSRVPPLAGSLGATLAGKDRVNVIWPEEYREVIANTAASILNALPENAGRKLHANQILDMLESHHSYFELCQLIEGIGFKIDRVRFAKPLFAVIPNTYGTPAQRAKLDVALSNRDIRRARVPENPNELTKSILKDTHNISGRGKQLDVSTGDPKTAQSSEAPNEPYIPSLTASSSCVYPILPNQMGPFKKANRTGLLNGGSARSVASNTRFTESSLLHQGPSKPREDSLPPQLHRQSPIYSSTEKDPAPIVVQDAVQEIPLGRPIASELMLAPRGSIDTALEEVLKQFCKNDIHSRRENLQQNFTTTHLRTHHPSKAVLEQSAHSWSSLLPTVQNQDSHQSSRLAVTATVDVQPNPATKEMAARKRTFAEIIDLTTDDVDSSANKDHSPNPNKVRRIGDSKARRDKQYGGAQQPSVPGPLAAEPQQVNLLETTSTHPHLDRKTTSSSEVEDILNPFKDFNHIVKPLDRSIALRISRYDPKSIARDVLISTARHPFQRGLNAHLQQLKCSFTKVDDSSDLSTFRWDLIDPGGPPTGSANMSSSTSETITKLPHHIQVSSTSNKDPKSSRLPIGRGRLRPTRGGSSLRGKTDHHGLKPDTTPAQPSGLRYSRGLESNFAVVIDSGSPMIIPPISHVRNRSNNSNISSFTRGRPGRPAKKLVHDGSFPPAARRVGRPPKDGSSRGGISHEYAKRKVGRPRIHPLSKSASKGKRAKPGPHLISPKFVAFSCEWSGCKAELHNLDTLRRHIFTVHNKQPFNIYACHWGKCRLTSRDGAAANEHYVFDEIDAYKDHVEKAHLIPFSWHMGDGPRGSTLDGNETDRSAYVSDMADRVTITSSTSQGVKQKTSAKIRSTWRPAWENRSFDPALDSVDNYLTREIREGFDMPVSGDWKRVPATKRSVKEDSVH